ncbi:hypothetical protein EUS_11740 [[Eubacterium] siraeum 70/3]|uniref:Uncharacterized protein n=1 Tax=[Eubacterium] siraeum 70/3 TaxID=657319 RepID=D4JTD4_9FIRM|nr:hypothetical protein EUS_11740 [[Eubacterium] siraeum 70/3]
MMYYHLKMVIRQIEYESQVFRQNISERHTKTLENLIFEKQSLQPAILHKQQAHSQNINT